VVEIEKSAGSNSSQMAVFGQNLSYMITLWLTAGRFIGVFFEEIANIPKTTGCDG
jgi:hypothetical protein